MRRYLARRRYFAAGRDSVRAWEDFTEPGADARVRRDALLVMAGCERTMSKTAFGFADADESDEDGFTLTQSHGFAALLLVMVAGTERDPQAPTPPSTTGDDSVAGACVGEDSAVFDVVVRLAAATDPYERGVLTLSLYDVVVARVGGQAAETLAAGVAYGYFLLAGMASTNARWLTGPAGPRWS